MPGKMPREIAPGVRAPVIDDAHLAAVEKYRELKPADLDVVAAAFGQLVEIAKRRPRHNR